jgi:hypothetical protein
MNRTVWVKTGQFDVHRPDPAREAFRMKLNGTGVVAVVVGIVALANGAQDVGAFFAVAGSICLLIVGLIPIKWAKVAEAGIPYKKK